MQTTRLGARGPEISRIGFGAWAIGGLDWGPAHDDATSRSALERALDDGVTFIDTADVYGRGHSEALVAEAVRGRDGICIATKAGNDFYNATADDDHGYGPIRPNMDADYLVFAAERSLARLGVERLDVLQLHSPPTEFLERDDPWDALDQLKRDGKIKHAGLSVASFKETEQTPIVERHTDLLDVVQVRYNLLEREAEDRLFPACLEHGVGVIVRIPLLFGLLTGKFGADARFGDEDHRRFNLAPEKLADYLTRLDEHHWLFEAFPDQTMAQVSLRFAISHPACSVVIPGGRTVEQVADNDATGTLGSLPGDVLSRLGVAG